MVMNQMDVLFEVQYSYHMNDLIGNYFLDSFETKLEHLRHLKDK